MPSVCFLNLKGGVGKTSTCFHLAGALAQRGELVLLVDADPQASLTQGLLGPPATDQLHPSQTVAALFDELATPLPAALVCQTAIDGLDLIPGSQHLTPANMTPPREWALFERCLSDALAELAPAYDMVLIDCPPNLYLCSWAALTASQYVVVPLQAEDFGSQGLKPVQAAIAAVQAGPNPGLRLAGYLLTMVDRRLSIHGTYEAFLRENFPGLVFETTVPRAKDYIEAVANRRPVSSLAPRSAAALAMDAVGVELLARCDALLQADAGKGAA
jgi:chromosome partitioning protein